MKFRDKRKNEVRDAYSIDIRDDKAYIRFSENGKEYAYNKDNIEVMKEESKTLDVCPFTVYKLTKHCYKCHKDTSVFTYIVFNDGTGDDVLFPWDKERLLENQDIIAHYNDPSIEYYGLKVVGDDEELDNILMNKFPDRIKLRYSKTQRRSYLMNICEHCGAKQGWNFIYRQVNERIKRMEKIETIE